MLIGFDISQTAEDKAGCGFFADQLIKNLAKIDTTNSYLLYSIFTNYRSINYHKATKILGKANFKDIFKSIPYSKVCDVWDKLDLNLLGRPQILHSNNFSCPKIEGVKTVYTLYDLSFLDCYDYTTEENRVRCFNGVFEASLFADRIIAISEFSKNRFLYYFPHFKEEKISVVHLGVRDTLKNNISENKSEKVLNKFGLKIGEEYWLSVGTIEPRKNYKNLIEAYAAYNNRSTDKKRLLIAGGKGWLYDDIFKKCEEEGQTKNIKFLGYVSDESLDILYQNCFGFIYPSLYEGFGLPVLEAMYHGAPIISSDTTSIPEVVGDAGILVDPYSTEEISEAMLFMERNGVRMEFKDKAHKRAQEFSWERAAEEVIHTYEKIYEENKI